jgi:hypothetical protein
VERAARIGLCLVAGLSLACSGDDGAERDPSATAEPSGAAPTEWPTAGFDLANSRAIAGGDLSTSTVGELEPRWTARLESLGALGRPHDRGAPDLRRRAHLFTTR